MQAKYYTTMSAKRGGHQLPSHRDALEGGLVTPTSGGCGFRARRWVAIGGGMHRKIILR